MLEVEFIAQSGFIFRSEKIRFVIDPFLQNPLNPLGNEIIHDMDMIFLTHDHSDHGIEYAMDVSKDKGVMIVAQYELANYLKQDRGLENVFGANIGGFFDLEGVKVKLLTATHSSGFGVPVGFMIRTDDWCIYHMGDTGYQADFEKIGKMFNIDLLLVPIGSLYTMDPYEASYAISDLQPTFAVPMHYNTYPKIQQDPDELSKELKERNSKTELIIMKPGDKKEFDL